MPRALCSKGFNAHDPKAAPYYDPRKIPNLTALEVLKFVNPHETSSSGPHVQESLKLRAAFRTE